MFDIKEEELKKNFAAHFREFEGDPPPDFMDKLMNLEVTHTFALSNDKGKTVVWKQIFLNQNSDHRGLLSYNYRQKHELQNSREPSENAEKHGLNDFVFAYLGSHDPYYGGKNTEPSFGVFISKELEKELTTNASRRDLASPEAVKSNEEIEFLKPEDARKLIAYEINKKYNGKIWYYWGSPQDREKETETETEYLKNMWTRKAEMHFFEKVPTSAIKAIIWPNLIHYTKDGFDSSYQIEERRVFSEQYPEIKIYDYDWMSDDGQDTFVEVSCKISQKFLNNNNRYLDIDLEESRKKNTHDH
jgi:hypothetical protein